MGMMNYAKKAIKNLFSAPATTKYPFVPREYPERTRGHIEIDFDQCVLCGSCQRHCPTGTIVVDRKGGSWSIGRMDCVQCGNCVQACPKKCLAIVPGYSTPGEEKTTDTFSRPVEPAAPKAAKAAPAAPDAAPKAAPAASGAAAPVLDSDKCILCGACAQQCPAGAITVDENGWKLNQDDCLGCGACVGACPADALAMGGASAPAEKPAEAAAPAEEAPGTRKRPGRRAYIPQFDADGKEIPVPACTLPEYNDEFADLPTSGADACIYCGICAKKCPKGAIEVDRKEKIWEIDNAECVRCGICSEVCPKKCIAKTGDQSGN